MRKQLKTKMKIESNLLENLHEESNLEIRSLKNKIKHKKALKVGDTPLKHQKTPTHHLKMPNMLNSATKDEKEIEEEERILQKEKNLFKNLKNLALLVKEDAKFLLF